MKRKKPDTTAGHIRDACLNAALSAYEDAKIRGLCAEGAWECAVEAIRSLKVNQTMRIEIKRVYDEPAKEDGTRVLVDRLWPRGLTKDDAALDHWAKDLAPSPDLRKWFNHDPDRFKPFAEKYRRELDDNRDAINALLDRIDRRKNLTLLYAAKDKQFNHAVVLKDHLESLI